MIVRFHCRPCRGHQAGRYQAPLERALRSWTWAGVQPLAVSR